MLAETPLYFYVGVKQFSGDQILVNIQERLALIYRLCLRNKDIFAEDFFFLRKTSLCSILLIRFIILRLFHNEIRGSILLIAGTITVVSLSN